LIRVVFDTNIYISGILFKGNPRKLLDMAIKGKIRLYVSPEIIDELKDVLARKKFGFAHYSIQSIINEIEAISALLSPAQKYSVISRDLDDNIIIDCAVEANADYIVTGDNDLLSLKLFQKIKIVNPAEFIEIYNSSMKE
jgi:uncharacterized protein